MRVESEEGAIVLILSGRKDSISSYQDRKRNRNRRKNDEKRRCVIRVIITKEISTGNINQSIATKNDNLSRLETTPQILYPKFSQFRNEFIL